MSPRLGVVAALLVAVLAGACTREEHSQTGTDSEGSTRPSTGRGVPSGDASLCYEAPRGDAADGTLTFSDSTAGLALVQPLLGFRAHATAVGDVNGDGWSDLFVGTFADRPPETYRARGSDGPAPDRLLLGGADRFRVDESFPAGLGRTSGAAFADLDGDDDLDLVLARNHREGDRGRAPSVVLRNDEGAFSEASVLDDHRSARSVGVLDYDGDRRLDLLLVEDRFGTGSSILLHNDGDLRFSDATAAAGLPRDLHGLGVAAADLTGDGLPDLFVSGSNRLFVNRGDGVLEEVDSPVPEWERYGDEDDITGVAVGDVNRDGRPDLAIGHHYNSTVDTGKEVAVRLYLNQGANGDAALRLRDVTEAAGLVGLPTKAPHVELVDLDADGWLDLLTSASAGEGTRPAVFRHRGLDDVVPRFEAPEGLGDARYWVTGATFDADHDGRVDIFMAEFEPTLPSILFRNESEIAHWIGVQVGPSGADGIGTTVEAYRAGAAGDASQRLGSQEIAASTGYGSGSLPIAHFGLGDEASADIVVTGPEGTTELHEVPADRLVQVASAASCGQ